MKTCIIKNSSNVHRIAHDGVNLLVCMKGGDYVYLTVPVEVFNQMCVAESAGKFLNAEVKAKYLYRPMMDDERRAMDEAEPVSPASLRGEGDRLIVPPLVNWPHPIDIKILDREVGVKYAKAGDAAFDLMAVTIRDPIDNEIEPAWPQVTFWLQPGEHVLIGTGIAMKLTPGLAGLVMPRSGLAKKHRVSVVNTPGLIDSGYTGEIGVLFENRGDEPFEIRQYDRIAQYMIVPTITPIFRVVADLEQTERGSAGFGSSGVAKGEDVVV